MQLAKYYGAEVTEVCSTPNLELVTSQAADHVIDHTKENFTENDERYDIIFDTVNKNSFSWCKRSLTKWGLSCNCSILDNHSSNVIDFDGV